MPDPAMVRNSLSVLSYANGFTLWHYTSADTLSDVTTTATYFDEAAPMVRAGDMIVCTLDTGNTPVGAVLIVSARTDAAVTVANLFAAAN